jgi:hypothetical protein
MTDCRTISDQLIERLYGELDADQAAQFDAHLASCPACRLEYESLQQTREAFREMPELEPAPGLSAMLLHEAARRGNAAEQGGWLSRLQRWFGLAMAHPGLVAAASLLLVAGVAGSLFVRGGGVVHPRARSAAPPVEPGAFAIRSGPEEPPEDRNFAGEEPGEEPGEEARGEPGGGMPGGTAAAPATALARRDSYAADLLDPEREGALRERQSKSRSKGKAAPLAPVAPPRTAERSKPTKKRELELEDAPRAERAALAQGRKGFAAPPPPVAQNAIGSATGRGAYPGGAGSAAGAPAVKQAAAPVADDELTAGADAPASPASGRAEAAPAPAGAPAEAMQEAAPQPARRSALAPLPPEVVRQQAQLQRAVARQRCDEAARLASALRERFPRQYQQAVQGIAGLGRCQQAIAAEARRRAARQKSAAEAEQASEPAAPAKK